MSNSETNAQIADAFSSIQGILKSAVKDPPALSEALTKLDFLSSSFSALFSIDFKKVVDESADERERKRIIVLDGIPESTKDSGHLRNLEDLDLVRSISDNLGLDSTIWATERLGKKGPHRPRLLKVFFLSSKASSLFLKGFNHLRRANPAFGKIFARFSQSAAERQKEFELRQEARTRTQREGTRYVVYAGTLTKQADIEALKQKLRKENSTAPMATNPNFNDRRSRSKNRSNPAARKRTQSRRPQDGTTPKQNNQSHVTPSLLREALSTKMHTEWSQGTTFLNQQESGSH